MHTKSNRTVNPDITYKHFIYIYIYIYIDFLLLIIYILFKLQMLDKKICKLAFVYLFPYSKL